MSAPASATFARDADVPEPSGHPPTSSTPRKDVPRRHKRFLGDRSIQEELDKTMITVSSIMGSDDDSMSDDWSDEEIAGPFYDSERSACVDSPPTPPPAAVSDKGKGPLKKGKAYGKGVRRIQYPPDASALPTDASAVPSTSFAPLPPSGTPSPVLSSSSSAKITPASSSSGGSLSPPRESKRGVKRVRVKTVDVKERQVTLSPHTYTTITTTTTLTPQARPIPTFAPSPRRIALAGGKTKGLPRGARRGKRGQGSGCHDLVTLTTTTTTTTSTIPHDRLLDLPASASASTRAIPSTSHATAAGATSRVSR